MARIDYFKESPIERNSLHEPAECTYSIFGIPGGKRILQIDTYGSEKRQIPGKKSQSIQLTEKTAAELLNILQEEFFKK